MSVDTEELATTIVEKMKAERHVMWMDPETHASQHEFIAQMILERKERAERRKRIEDRIAGSLVLSVILAAIGFLGAGVMVWLRRNL